MRCCSKPQIEPLAWLQDGGCYAVAYRCLSCEESDVTIAWPGMGQPGGAPWINATSRKVDELRGRVIALVEGKEYVPSRFPIWKPGPGDFYHPHYADNVRCRDCL